MSALVSDEAAEGSMPSPHALATMKLNAQTENVGGRVTHAL